MGNSHSVFKKMDGACYKWSHHIYTTTAPSCCIPASYCHLSAILQTISIVANLQDNRGVFRIFIALLRFSFDSPSYINSMLSTLTGYESCNTNTLSSVRSAQQQTLAGKTRSMLKLNSDCTQTKKCLPTTDKTTVFSRSTVFQGSGENDR
jgi:hypothetical protein